MEKNLLYDKMNATPQFDGTNNEIVVALADIPSLFYPAYCITIHKAQGSSFDHPYTIYISTKPKFNN